MKRNPRIGLGFAMWRLNIEQLMDDQTFRNAWFPSNMEARRLMERRNQGENDDPTH